MSNDLDDDTILRELDSVTRPRCECLHRDGECPMPADYRVSSICQVAGCDCAAFVDLACDDCLGAWRRDAARQGIRLRVLPL